jgi:UDP-glucuronate decarboxylase
MLQSVSVTTVVFGVGYIGSALVQDLLFQGREVVGVDNFFSTDRRAIDGFAQSPTFQFVPGSVTDANALDRAFDLAGESVDTVYILAAQASADLEAASAEYTEETNLRGPRLILESVHRRSSAATVVFASSTRVYGSPLPAVVDESTPLGSFSDLSHLSKCYVEKLLEMYAVTVGLKCRSVRLGLTFGVAPVFKTDRRFMTAPNLFCYQAATGTRISVRSHDSVALIHVSDAVDALLLAASATDEKSYAVYNAVGEVATIGAIAALVGEIAAEREIPVEIEGLRADATERSEQTVISSGLTRFGFVPHCSLREGVTETIDHFLVRGL